jgi:hypothetical protein
LGCGEVPEAADYHRDYSPYPDQKFPNRVHWALPTAAGVYVPRPMDFRPRFFGARKRRRRITVQFTLQNGPIKAGRSMIETAKNSASV